jgi:hypothetical protein
VGAGARFMVGLKRYLPDQLFARVYAAQVLRMVTRPGRSEKTDPVPARLGMERND